MEQFLQAAAAVLLAVVLCLTLGKQGKDMAVLLAMGVCCMVMVIAMRYLEPVVEFLEKLEFLGDLNGEMVGSLFKIVGIGILTEIAAMVCTDSGNGSMGKSLQILGSSVILWLSIPILTALIELIQDILEGV